MENKSIKLLGLAAVVTSMLLSGCNGNNSSSTSEPTVFTEVAGNIDLVQGDATWEGIEATDISDANLFDDEYGDAYDGAFVVEVDGTGFDPADTNLSLSEDNTTVITAVEEDITAGINAQKEYWFSPTRSVVRMTLTLTNTSASAINDINVWISTDFGSDSDTTLEATSDGDLTAEDTDLWYVHWEDSTSGDPRIISSRYGTGASVVPTDDATPENGDEYLDMNYVVSIPAGETVRIMLFSELTDPSEALSVAVTKAGDYDSLTDLDSAGLLEGLSQEQLDTIVNY